MPKMHEKSTRDMLIERREQLEKDIENYQHMLEEANDLKKSWERSESEMKNIVPSKNFTDNSNAFDGTIDVSLNSVDKANVPAKDKGSRVPFENLVSFGQKFLGIFGRKFYITIVRDTDSDTSELLCPLNSGRG